MLLQHGTEVWHTPEGKRWVQSIEGKGWMLNWDPSLVLLVDLRKVAEIGKVSGELCSHEYDVVPLTHFQS